MTLVNPGDKIQSYVLNDNLIGPANAFGLVMIAPTGLQTGGGTISSTPLGKVTVSGLSSLVGVIGVFSPVYENYLVKLDLTTDTNAGINMQMSFGNVQLASGYDSQVMAGVGTSTPVDNQVLASGSWPIAAASQTIHKITLDLHCFDSTRGSVVPAPIYGSATAAAMNNPPTSAAATAVRQLSQSSALGFDGFYLTPAAGHISGVIRVYGLNNG
ncbi:hypothetical protein G3T36_10655 [Diaminobutyricibacter tongyongensis]|uniref:Uncharacterized protein n=1 Tax=Leifsonia tongyongensis TaxID=1268043 RepID=A0A6L9XYH1_9MICO|nr:hypothetical protein [Diaminobutyricibacter tongyongensis]NEN06336.1 hypothetical protein [Diaminobutyricibacter tongyongensis]